MVGQFPVVPVGLVEPLQERGLVLVQWLVRWLFMFRHPALGMQPLGMQPLGMQPLGMQPLGMQPLGMQRGCRIYFPATVLIGV